MDELTKEFSDSLTLHIALDVSKGMTLEGLAHKYEKSIREMINLRKDPEVSRLAMVFTEDRRTAAFFMIVSNCETAVRELVAFLGLPDMSPRDEIAAINLILSIGLKESKDSKDELVLKGGDRQTIQQIKDKLLRIHA